MRRPYILAATVPSSPLGGMHPLPLIQRGVVRGRVQAQLKVPLEEHKHNLGRDEEAALRVVRRPALGGG